jgi:hypothetical protein
MFKEYDNKINMKLNNYKSFQICLFIIFIITLLRINVVDSFEMFQEGFLNLEGRPGALDDERGKPNLPLATDTNRYSDGFTSSLSFDITSPHFPQYHASLADKSDRYLRYSKYMESAAEQGIAGYGAGDAVREAARYMITSLPNYQSLPRPTKTFPVYAALKWNPSDFAIQEGEYYNISVFGAQDGFSEQFWSDGGIRVNSMGYDSYYDAVSSCYVAMGRCRAHLKKKRRLLTANWMSLACAIGEFVRPIGEIKPGDEEVLDWLPLDEAILQETVIPIGRSTVFRAIFSGQLICFANDAHANYWNNAGNLEVTATRISWPPINGTYYRDLSVPACDSAIAVYGNSPEGMAENNGMPFECNPNGGGAGWLQSDVDNTLVRYGSGMPANLLDPNS